LSKEILIPITFGTTEDAKYDYTKEGGNGETMSVVKEQVTICPYMKFPEGTVLTRFTARVIIIREVLR